MVLDHAQLRALLAVSRARSFEGASRELGITPSAVSQRIRALEEYVGAVLLRRNGRIAPTDSGIVGSFGIKVRDATCLVRRRAAFALVP